MSGRNGGLMAGMRGVDVRGGWAGALALVLAAVPLGCGDDSGEGTGGSGTSSATTASSTATGGSASTGTAQGGTGATTGATSSTGGGSGDGGAGEGGAGEGGAGGAGSGGSAEGGSAPVCTQAREDALGPIDEVSAGEVLVLDQDDGSTTVWVDASAGGIQVAAENPWIYIDLDGPIRVDVGDVAADADTTWDLALKRPIVRVNGGDGGLAGSGASAFVDAAFDDVGASDVAAAAFATESWFDAECTLATDPTGAIATSFDGWYLYEDMTVTPAPGTWLVRAGDGEVVHKVEILAYYANPDGSAGQAGGRYVLRVARVEP